jgi:hypothetical protein
VLLVFGKLIYCCYHCVVLDVNSKGKGSGHAGRAGFAVYWQ